MSTATTPPSPPSPQPQPSQTPPPLSQTLPPLLPLQQQQQQPRKVPPPCWTHEETLALIECYRDRWIALRRGYLRTADWDAVAASVSAGCNNLSLSLSKTSAQCRHKIEKLRQRYRAEKQRCVSFPGKFFSTWIFFKKLEFIDGGSSSPAAGSDVIAAAAGNGRKGKIRVKTKSVAERSTNLIDAAFVDGGSNPSFNRDFDDVADISVKVVGERPSVFIGSKNYAKNEGSHSNHHLHNDHVVRTGLYVNSLGDRSFVPPPAKRPGHFDGKYTSNVDFNDDRIYTGHEYLGSNLADHTAIPLRFRSTNSSYVNGNSSPYAQIDRHDVDDDDDDDDDVDTPTPVRAKAPANWHPGPPVFRSKHSYNYHGDTFSKLDSHMLNGYPSLNKCVQKGDGGGGTEREMDHVLEIASSIKHFGEGFIKIEKMKMDMAMEIEKMKMEMETKRNEMILDSQKQIVDAFLKVLGEKNKKAKVTASPQS